MKITLTTEQTVFLARAQSRLQEAMSSAASEQHIIQEFISQNQFIQAHSAILQSASATVKSQQNAIADYVSSLGYPGAELEHNDGTLMLSVTAQNVAQSE
jgi:hypothetical protein